jgi:hypothetical protein
MINNIGYFFYTPSYVGNSASGFGNSVRTAIQRSFCGANGGWRIALTFCFFFVKEKENDKL